MFARPIPLAGGTAAASRDRLAERSSGCFICFDQLPWPHAPLRFEVARPGQFQSPSVNPYNRVQSNAEQSQLASHDDVRTKPPVLTMDRWLWNHKVTTLGTSKRAKGPSCPLPSQSGLPARNSCVVTGWGIGRRWAPCLAANSARPSGPDREGRVRVEHSRPEWLGHREAPETVSQWVASG